MARLDPLGVVHACALLERRLPELFDESAGRRASPCVLVLDICHFRTVNDEDSHEAQ